MTDESERGTTLSRMRARPLPTRSASRTLPRPMRHSSTSWERPSSRCDLNDQLRGCVAALAPRRALGEDVRANARARRRSTILALPRLKAEYSALAVEVSGPVAIDPDRLCQRRRSARTTAAGGRWDYARMRRRPRDLLPQAWDHVSDPRELLTALKHKAGLDPGFWSPEVKVSGHRPQVCRGRSGRGEPVVNDATHSAAMRSHAGSYPGRWWHGLPTAASSATCARATAGCTKGSAASASCASAKGDAMVLTTYGRSSGFCIDPIEKKPLNHFYPGHERALVRHGGLQPRAASSARTGTSRSRARWIALDGRGHARGDRRAPRRRRLPQRRVHLQRSGDLRRVRDGHRRRLPRARASRPSPSPPATSTPSRGASSTRRWTRPTST